MYMDMKKGIIVDLPNILSPLVTSTSYLDTD